MDDALRLLLSKSLFNAFDPRHRRARIVLRKAVDDIENAIADLGRRAGNCQLLGRAIGG